MKNIKLGPKLIGGFCLTAIIALAAGIGLAFLAHYLDDLIRSREDLDGLGLPVIGESPRRR